MTRIMEVDVFFWGGVGVAGVSQCRDFTSICILLVVILKRLVFELHIS
jgi:hypothetical protein